MLAFVESLLTIFFVLIGSIELLILLFVVLPWVIAILDILTHEYTDNNKLIWLIAVIFIPFIGTIGYFIIGQNQKIRKQ